ncbi:MAG: pilin, partial [Planctomycetes bacterium]|nr:pilin [Planctomycetota bacterium]
DIDARGSFPDGGGYRLDADGSIVITFTVLPDLAGRSLTFAPRPAADGSVHEWQCSADPGLRRAYLPRDCREPR